MEYDKLILVVAIIIALSLIISVIKKVAKTIIFLLIVILAFSVFKAIDAGKSPADVINSSKYDVSYTKQIYDYTKKIKKSVDESINALENKSLPQIKEENKNLHNYLDKVINLPHGAELNILHKKYCDYLKNIVATSDTLVKGAQVSNGVVKNAQETKNNFNKYLDGLLEIKEKYIK